MAEITDAEWIAELEESKAGWRRRVLELVALRKDEHRIYDDNRKRIAALEKALRLVLLFYTVGPWTGANRAQWLETTGASDATTKAMCDHIRGVLDV